ncbi:hypothetical protein HV268_12795 [Enterobacter roggenkampii]|uniref:hypothetical protein n=1 Tax=Enterobacter roggenkampii TaxID=1812935 RepID=UPI0015EA15BA|nr:hypothetical protein [Enterobacter roggenkampii]QLU97235.1 hypothetical protein HV268_12795 [Enterobacter roggenkampii]
MDYHIEDITAFDNDNGSGIIARVVFHYETHLKSISVNGKRRLSTVWSRIQDPVT